MNKGVPLPNLYYNGQKSFADSLYIIVSNKSVNDLLPTSLRVPSPSPPATSQPFFVGSLQKSRAALTRPNVEYPCAPPVRAINKARHAASTTAAQDDDTPFSHRPKTSRLNITIIIIITRFVVLRLGFSGRQTVAVERVKGRDNGILLLG